MKAARPRRGAWLLLSVLACGGEPAEETGGVRIAYRFIAEQPAETFDRSRLYQRADVFTWRFDSAADRAPWTVQPPAAATPVTGGVSVRGGRPAPALIREVNFDAGTIDAIEVDVTGLRQGPLALFWKREGEKFVAERGQRVRGAASSVEETLTYTLALAGHGGWRGRIRCLRLDPTTADGEVVTVEAVRGVRFQAAPGVPQEAARKAWGVELDHELRSALLAPPGTPIERLVDVPDGARLRFGYGVRGAVGVPVVFRVTALPDGAVATQEPEALFEARLDPAADDLAAWRDAAVDLAELAGASVRLVLETSSAGTWDPSSGMPVFANPEVLAPALGPARPNVVLISIDTLRADHLSLYGYPRRTSPHLDAWAARSGIMFENAVVSAPWTLPSHASLLSGIDSDRHGAVNHGAPMPPTLKTLPEYLRVAGYRTLAITGGGWMRPEYGFARGVDRYRYWPQGVDRKQELEHGTARAEQWLEDASEDPFFLFFHTFEVHSPHRRRKPYYGAFVGSEEPDPGTIIEKSVTLQEEGFVQRKTFVWQRKGVEPRLKPIAEDELLEVIARYDSAIALTDAAIGRLLERLATLGLDRDTLVIVTSDHGDAFGEKGLASHGYLYDFNLLVPLIVALPAGTGGGRRVVEQVRSIDVVPTVLDVLGLPVPAAPEIDGTSLRGLLEGRADGAPREAWSYATSSNRGISLRLDNRHKYILNHTPWPPYQGREELYDLSADPAEEQDLATTGPRLRDVRRRAVRRLIERVQGVVVHVRNGEDEPLRGVLRGAAVREFRLKTLAPEGAPLTWTDLEPGIARFTVPPGGFGAYLLESAGTEPLGVEIEVGPGGLRRFRVDTAALDPPWQVRYFGSAWQQSAAAARTAVIVSRRGAGGASAADPAAIDPQLRAELKALGYLDD